MFMILFAEPCSRIRLAGGMQFHYYTTLLALTYAQDRTFRSYQFGCGDGLYPI